MYGIELYACLACVSLASLSLLPGNRPWSPAARTRNAASHRPTLGTGRRRDDGCRTSRCHLDDHHADAPGPTSPLTRSRPPTAQSIGCGTTRHLNGRTSAGIRTRPSVSWRQAARGRHHLRMGPCHVRRSQSSSGRLVGLEFSSCVTLPPRCSWRSTAGRLIIRDSSSRTCRTNAWREANVPSYTNLNETTPCRSLRFGSRQRPQKAGRCCCGDDSYLQLHHAASSYQWPLMTHATHTTVRATVGFKRTTSAGTSRDVAITHQWKRAGGTNTLLILGRCIIFGIWGSCSPT